MIFLRCLLCDGECNIVGDEYTVQKKIRCQDCGYTNAEEKKEPEIIRRRPFGSDTNR